MRIIQVVHAFEPAVGGIETHVQQLSLALARSGSEVVVHTAAPIGWGPAAREQARLVAQVDARLAQAGVRVKRHLAIKFPLFSSLVWMPGLPLFIALERGDAVCSHGFGSPTPICAAIGARLSGKPFYWTVHGLPRFQSGLGRFALGVYRTLFAPIGFALARSLIAVSDPVAEGLRAMGVRKAIAVIPNGISDRFLAADLSKPKAASPFTVLFVGRLDASKGVRTLARAFMALHARHPDSRLRFVGPDEGERAWLQTYAQEHGLPVSFEQVRSDEIPAVYASSSVCVLPSEYEGFGLCVLESWACGTPALSTPVGIAPQFNAAAFGSQAPLFLFKDAAELVERLESLYLVKPTARSAWAVSARAALAGYTWDEVAKKTKEQLAPNA